MAQPAYIQKTLRMTPEVNKIFDDLDAWLDYCRFNLIEFNPKDLYKSREYKEFTRNSSGYERKPRGDYNRSGNNKKFQKQ